MNTTLNTPANFNTTARSQVSFSLTMAGIVIAIFCSVTVLYDGYSTTRESSNIPTLIDASTISGIREFFTPVSNLIANVGNKVIGIAGQ
jgi:hypothetical protein